MCSRKRREEREGRNSGKRPRESGETVRRSVEEKFRGDLRFGPSPGFLFLSLSTSKKCRDPSVNHLVGIPLLTLSGSKEEGF